MRVSLYHVEDSRMSYALPRHVGEDAFRLKLELRCLARKEFFGRSLLMAAAQVYFDAVGTYRLEKLRELNAPAVVIDSQANPRAIAAQLVPSSLVPGYLLDNGVESWLITVDCDFEQPSHFSFGTNLGGIA
jgi:hypothetical protein